MICVYRFSSVSQSLKPKGFLSQTKFLTDWNHPSPYRCPLAEVYKRHWSGRSAFQGKQKTEEMVKAPETMKQEPQYPRFFDDMPPNLRDAVVNYIQKGDFSTAQLIVSQLPGEIRYAFSMWRLDQEGFGPINR